MVRKQFMVCLLLSFAVMLPPAAALAGEDPVNMLSLQEGTLPVVVPPSYGGWHAERLLDDSPESGWASESGRINDNVFVFEMVGETVLERFEFDNAAVDAEGAAARDVVVEVSAASRDSGFSPVLAATLADRTDGQILAASARVPARWVRLTIRTNQGSPEWTELFSFRGFGARPARQTSGNISGTYDSSYARFHVRQQGTSLTGCYEYNEGLLNGAIEGRVMKITWQEGPDQSGPAVMVFSEDGKSFRGYWWQEGGSQGAPADRWDGTRISGEVGSCPHWSGSLGGELQKKLSEEKRARLYGILFDFNSAVIRSDSKAVLEEVRDLLTNEPGWKLTIEGHTDAVGPDDRNLVLSQQRAEAVKVYLVAAGVDAARLATKGFGESVPVDDNASELGRARNRRVELVRE